MKNHLAMPRTYLQRISSLKIAKETPEGIVGECIEFDQRSAYNAQICACQNGIKVSVRKITKPDGSNVWALWLISKPTKGAK